MRNKWTKDSHRNLKIGDLVWMVDEQSKRSDYKMARVAEIHPGTDNIVRAATIKTADGIYKRPVVKLAPVLNFECF